MLAYFNHVNNKVSIGASYYQEVGDLIEILDYRWDLVDGESQKILDILWWEP